MDSIQYASRIQQAILPYETKLQKGLADYFILYQPRDIVSGDFYWYQEVNGLKIIVVADCTGHGVPGAFMSMIGHSLLDQTIMIRKILDPGAILDAMHQGIKLALQQDKTTNTDGMDMSLCVINEKEQELLFAGARNSLIYIQGGELKELKADRQSVGGSSKTAHKPFTTKRLSLEQTTDFFMYSDGFQDQFGGEENRKLMRKRFKKLLLETNGQNMQSQHEQLATFLKKWMNPSKGTTYRQLDDILIIGARIKQEVRTLNGRSINKKILHEQG